MLYSRMDPLGTGRSTGLGGAMTSLGADLGAVWSNPAGLGMYRTSDVGFSLAIGAGGGRTTFAYRHPDHCGTPPDCGTSRSGPHHALEPPPIPQGHLWHRLHPVAGPAPTRGMGRGSKPAKASPSSSPCRPQGTRFDSLWYSQPFDADLAWYTYLIDTVSGTCGPIRRGLQWRRRRVKASGGTAPAAWGNHPRLRHELRRRAAPRFERGPHVHRHGTVDVYSERKQMGPSPLDRFTFNDRLQVSGSGAFWAFGLILQPENTPLRFGWSYRSGTVFSIDDFYQVDATSDFSDGTGYEWNSPNSYVQYRIRTPRQHRLGFSWTMGKAALLTLDYGYADFAQATFTSNDFRAEDVAAIQPEIDSTLVAEQQVRGGLEFRIQDTWRFRWEVAGTAAAQPWSGSTAWKMAPCWRTAASASSGPLAASIGRKTWYAGATYRHTSTEDARRLYALSPAIAEGRTGLGLLMTVHRRPILTGPEAAMRIRLSRRP